MTSSSKKPVLLLFTHSPYGSSLAKAGLDVALATAAFEQTVDVLFLGDGVLQLHPEQDSHELGIKNLSRQLASLPLYDIDCVYVDAEAATRYNMDLSKAPLATRSLCSKEMHELMTAYDHLLGF